MSITAKELAIRLKLSEAAVSMALHNKPGVSTKTRKKVLEAAKESGYDFSRIQENQVVSSKKGLITLLICKKHGAVISDTPFFSQLTEGIDIGCIENQYSLNIRYVYIGDNLSVIMDDILHSGIKGIIIMGTEMQRNDFKAFEKCSVPFVLLDTYYEDVSCDYILINNVQGAYMATSYLISRCKRQPGYLHSSYEINNFAERAEGFFKAIRESGMSTSNSIIHRLSPSMEGAYGDMKSLLERGEKLADCYFADNDLIASGAMKAFKDHGYLIPKDISIIGFDNMPISTYMDPPLSTVHVPKQYLGEMAVRRLVTLMEGQRNNPVKLEISTNLMIRGSIK